MPAKSEENSSRNPDLKSRIVCPVAPWFHRRMGMLVALMLAAGLYFLYDGLIGYPGKNFNVALYEAFQAAKTSGKYPTAESVGLTGFSEKQKWDLEEAFQAGQDRVTWAEYAASRHLAAAKPEGVTDGEIRQQIMFAGIFGIAVLAGLVFWIIQSRQVLACGEDEIEFPGGKRVKFDEIDHIDLEKWDRGIALLKAHDGKILGKLDDYKYRGAGDIEHRLQIHLSEETIGA